jgi:hypothetical protein
MHRQTYIQQSRRAGCDSALQSGLSCSELGSVALNLDPGLDPGPARRAETPA